MTFESIAFGEYEYPGGCRYLLVFVAQTMQESQLWSAKKSSFHLNWNTHEKVERNKLQITRNE